MYKVELECGIKTNCEVINAFLSEEAGRRYRSGSLFFIPHRASDTPGLHNKLLADTAPDSQKGKSGIDCIMLHAFTTGNTVIPPTDTG